MREALILIKPEHSLTLIGWAWKNWKEGSCLKLIDPSIRDICNLQEALKCIAVGLLCVQEFPGDRPTIYAAILMLRKEIPPIPMLMWDKLTFFSKINLALRWHLHCAFLLQ